MRVSNALTTRTLVTRLLGNQAALAAAQQRATSGKKVERASDDPTAASTIMQANTGLRGIEQYQRNLSAVTTRLDAEDTALGQVTDVLARARELAAAGASSTTGVAARRAAGQEVRGLLEQAVHIGNQRFAGEYLFGGANAHTPPFDASRAGAADHPFATLVPGGGPPTPTAAGERVVEGAAGQVIRGQHSGQAAFLDTGVFTALKELADVLDPPGGVVPPDQTERAAQAAVTLTRASDAVQAVIGDLGARQNQGDAIRASLDAMQATYTQQRSDLSEVDMEQAITEMVQRQTAYQAAMLASSKLMGLSLTDYLR